MDTTRKRAALFEYFKQINNPKWVTNGQKLFDALNDMKAPAVDAMYARMLELKAKAEALKKSKEIPMYKRWKMPLFLLCLWGVLAVTSARSGSSVANCMLQAFIAGSYFQELIDNILFNMVTKKLSKEKGSV